MRDYTGSFKPFEESLRKAGVTKEEFDITEYAGCTYNELLGLTKQAIAIHKSKEEKNL